MTTIRFAVDTIIGLIRVRVACELIIATSDAAKMLSNVGSGFVILENSFGTGDMSG